MQRLNHAHCPRLPPQLPQAQGTVGAGLPVMSTLKQLLDTGDEVQRIEGIFRCTLHFFQDYF